MYSRLTICTAMLVLAIGCSSMKVNTDFDQEADFSSYKTYAWHESATNIKDTNPLAHERFVGAVSDKPEKNTQKVNQAAQKIFEKYPPSAGD